MEPGSLSSGARAEANVSFINIIANRILLLKLLKFYDFKFSASFFIILDFKNMFRMNFHGLINMDKIVFLLNPTDTCVHI